MHPGILLPQAAGVAVRVMHASASSAGTLCASLSAGESFRSMRIIAVPFAKGEAAAVAAAQLQGAARPYGGLVAPSSATQDSDRARLGSLTRKCFWTRGKHSYELRVQMIAAFHA